MTSSHAAATIRSKKTTKKKKNYKLWIYLLPCIIFVAAFAYVPIAGWILAFMDYIPGIPLSETPFVGLKYFELILSDYSNMLRVMKNTIIFALIGYLVASLSMIFAIALNEIKSNGLKRTIQTYHSSIADANFYRLNVDAGWKFCWNRIGSIPGIL